MDIDNLENGSFYSITSDSVTREGVFVNATSKYVFLKLNSGYNVGIAKSKIKKVNLLKEKPLSKQTEQVISKKTGNADVLILHTGGTIASKVDYSTGGVSDKFSPEEILALFPELSSLASIDSKLVSNMPSDDMNFSHYNTLIDEVKKNHTKFKGIIITHGTDTLHYTSAALRFALKNIPIPVVLVGSQRSSDRPSSDAAINLLNAVYFITKKIPGVFICMHKDIKSMECHILDGVNVKKMHSSRRDAFKQINSLPLATIDFKNDYFALEKSAPKPDLKVEFLKYKDDLKIGMVHARPNMFSKELALYASFDGLVLAGTGLGHFPITQFDSATAENNKIFKAIIDLASKIPVAMTTQTVNGTVNLNVYSPGRKLKDAGVLGHNCNMCYETAYIKLAYLLSNHPLEVKELYSKDLQGELSIPYVK